MRTPAIATFLVVFAFFAAVGFVKSKPPGMVLGTASIAAAAAALLAAWKTLEYKRTQIAAAAYEDVLRGGMGAVIVNEKTGKAQPVMKPRKKSKKCRVP